MGNINIDYLLKEFYDGKSIEELAIKYGMTWSSMYQIIGNRLPCKKELSELEEEEILFMYNNGMSATKIGERFKICHKLVNKILDKYGIERKYNGVRKWKLNEDYFDVIDNQNKAYILGFLYADGYNDLNKKTVRLQLRYDDKEILEKINKELGSNRPLKRVNCSSKIAKNGYISKDMYSLEVYGNKICNSLENKGMTQGKSLTLNFPNFLNQDLIRHFIRGYYDGDGSFSYSNANASRRYQGTITITSTEQFCEDCLWHMRNELGIGGSIVDASCHNGITKVLAIGGNKQCKKVLDWFYNDAILFLERKHNKYINAYYSNAA